MTTRQASSVARIRAARRDAGQCAGCGAASATYWCPTCSEKRRPGKAAYMREYMRRRRALK